MKVFNELNCFKINIIYVKSFILLNEISNLTTLLEGCFDSYIIVFILL